MLGRVATPIPAAISWEIISSCMTWGGYSEDRPWGLEQLAPDTACSMLQFLEFVIRGREMARDLLYQAFRVGTCVGVGDDTPLGLGRAGAQSASTSVTTHSAPHA